MQKILLFIGCITSIFCYAQSPISKFDIDYLNEHSLSFTNKTEGATTSVSWEFSGGVPSTSNTANPTVSYSIPGTYEVKLISKNDFGSSTSIRTIKVSSSNIIDLGSGRNDDGTIMSDSGISDPDWTYTDPSNNTSTPYTRYTATAAGWSTASVGNISGVTRWITGGSVETGDHYYKSKVFEIPQGTTGYLNLRTLSFVRNWTYLVKKNDDGTETETEITRTSWMNDGAKGWLNSRSPEVINYRLSSGIYYIKVKAYTNTTGQRQAIDVNGNVSFGNSYSFSPQAEFSANPMIAFINENIQFNNLTQIQTSNVSWKFNDGNNFISSSENNPNISFATIEDHDAELTLDYGNNLISSLKVEKFISTKDETDFSKAPNSYIFYNEGKLPNGKRAEGLYIPVKKAYQMWSKGRYMQNEEGIYTPIDINGTQSASVFWEDVDGLIKSVSIDNQLGTGENARLKVIIDNNKGKGNASIAFRVNGVIYWTWHVWVTDNPENGAQFGQDFETDINGVAFQPQYMDRNLGATNVNFIGNDWHKSGGLLFQWGRKDPFPPLVYKDFSFYEITGDIGSIRHKSSALGTPISLRIRGVNTPSNNINSNIRYSINNPIDMIIHGTQDGTWFSNQQYKVSSANLVDIETWDLWSDNRKGLNSNASSSNSALAADSKSYELKSEFDPCPNGWRVASHYGRNTVNNNLNPFGRRNSGVNDDTIPLNRDLDPNIINPVLNGIKVYPGLGFDFTGVTNRNLGILSINGNYEFYSSNDGSSMSAVYQDQSSDGSLHTATYGIGGVRNITLFSDPEKSNVSSTGYNSFLVNQTSKTNGADGIRCMRDPNLMLLPIEYDTEFIISTNNDQTDYKSWTKQPNSIIVMTGDNNEIVKSDKIVKISLKKAYAMHKLYLSENNQLPIGAYNNASVVWTSNNKLIKKAIITGLYPDQYLEVTVSAQEKGNAVVGFHKGNNGIWETNNPDKILWSWHIWAPITDPSNENNLITYTTESIENGGIIPTTSGHFVNPTKSLNPPLKTIFMDRNLGALNPLPSTLVRPNLTVEKESKTTIQQSGGLHYQWGRKDPLPTFHYPGGDQYMSAHNNSVRVSPTYNIFKQIGIDNFGNVIYDTNPITESIFMSTDNVNGYSKEWNNYKQIANVSESDKKNVKIRKIIKFSTENPLSYLFRNRTGSEIGFEDAGPLYAKTSQVKDWISDENGLALDRWGHGTEKSPYDPCPEGWRVPDTTKANLFAGGPKGSYAKGSSPWFYNGYNTNNSFATYGITQGEINPLTGGATNNIISDKKYPGYTLSITTEGSTPSSRTGWVFDFTNSKYNIGNIPTTGIRGILGGNDWKNPRYLSYPNADNYRYQTGLWTSSPGDHFSGYAIGLSINSTSGWGGNLASGYGFYPQAAMAVRCVKDTERYMGDLEYTSSSKSSSSITSLLNIKSNEKRNEFILYPNPVNDYLTINGDLNKNYLYQILDTSGRVIIEGEFINNKTNLSNLKTGVYFIVINNNYTYKIIKN
ncbi:PKD domain-containing protein [Empedobacter tilapiae]|uniref:PKD domain-containing protein n=1 Tax=Empedobacter tilapiae TaxID=2491114 RepID=A0A4Z1BEF8_9FLAO|nr:PKD domain-containing protein [Empedobacter tilapiae]TGN27154.1 PKD domain-containing protein [Empedobacter tilapiae]